ncbi:hypothetical protein E2320_002261, partial [Naja naja]
MNTSDDEESNKREEPSPLLDFPCRLSFRVVPPFAGGALVAAPTISRFATRPAPPSRPPGGVLLSPIGRDLSYCGGEEDEKSSKWINLVVMLKLKQSCYNQRQDELDVRQPRKCPRQRDVHSINPTQLMPRIESYETRGKKGISDVRRTFCLFVTFDFLFITLLWIIELN